MRRIDYIKKSIPNLSEAPMCIKLHIPGIKDLGCRTIGSHIQQYILVKNSCKLLINKMKKQDFNPSGSHSINHIKYKLMVKYHNAA